MRKIILTVWIISLACMLSFPCSATEEREQLFWSGRYKYSINDDGTVTIRHGPDSSETPLVIPGELDGRQVTKIGENAFLNYYKSVDKLTSVVIPSSVTTIENNAFASCSNLTSIEIPPSVIEIGFGAFCGCVKLTNVTLPSSVKTLGRSSFSSCEQLTSIEIPSSVTLIEDGAFSACKNLSNISVSPDSKNFAVIDDVLFNTEEKTLLFYPYRLDKAELVIPEGTLRIGSCVFTDFDKLVNVKVPSSVTTIGERAFSFCDNLTSIEIPSSVKEIGDFAFEYCQKLTSIEIPSSITTIEAGAFLYCNGLTSMEIPNSVTTIEDGAFAYCEGLTNIKIPSSVTTIGEHAFGSCPNLTSIEIPSSVKTIEKEAFIECEKLILTVNAGSYALQYAEENGIPYIINENATSDASNINTGENNQESLWDMLTGIDAADTAQTSESQGSEWNLAEDIP